MATGPVALVTGAGRGIGAHGVAATGAGIDVADLASVRAATGRVETELRPIEALVNNAGIDIIKPFVDSTEDEWDRVIAVNLKGTIGCCRAVLDGMIDRPDRPPRTPPIAWRRLGLGLLSLRPNGSATVGDLRSRGRRSLDSHLVPRHLWPGHEPRPEVV
jgi:NAD(P)-dependent dehydrogenase (short-subunit alcohol dehydrogenase family)